MIEDRPALFRGGHFADDVVSPIFTSSRDLAEMINIDFFLSETRDVSAARTFFHKVLAAPNHPRPRVTNVYPNVIDELKRIHALDQRCRCRVIP